MEILQAKSIFSEIAMLHLAPTTIFGHHILKHGPISNILNRYW